MSTDLSPLEFVSLKVVSLRRWSRKIQNQCNVVVEKLIAKEHSKSLKTYREKFS